MATCHFRGDLPCRASSVAARGPLGVPGKPGRNSPRTKPVNLRGVWPRSAAWKSEGSGNGTGLVRARVTLHFPNSSGLWGESSQAPEPRSRAGRVPGTWQLPCGQGHGLCTALPWELGREPVSQAPPQRLAGTCINKVTSWPETSHRSE